VRLGSPRASAAEHDLAGTRQLEADEGLREERDRRRGEGQLEQAVGGKRSEGRMRLKVNASKSAVARPDDRHFLGFSLRRDAETGAVEVFLSMRSRERIAAKIVDLTRRNRGQSFRDCIQRLNAYTRGWIGFFGICSEVENRKLQTLDAHIRRRLRALKLKHWKRRRSIVRALIAMGANPRTAWRRIYVGKRRIWDLSNEPVENPSAG
jgi:hypothetical protein